MIEIKNHTSLEQSKILVEFLPLESADMYYSNDEYPKPITKYEITYAKVLYGSYDIQYFKIFGYTPCWSLGALINLLPSSLKDEIGMEFHLSMHKDYIEYVNSNVSGLYSTYMHTCGNNNLVDACYEMIIKLHEQKLL